ncbi:imidazole glycerol phosphate synthase subunit HisH [Azotosporobacter soli]|uniref:imidazole glycerol phosphate synthase subunit HisH n=1 Tax=Azotosporobacter soli TaxID=3055040 RepID=UPI0031FEBFC8
MKQVTIIDYGIGNLLSVRRAFEYVGAEVIISDNAADILKAEALILPGVGAFANGMKELRDRGFVKPIIDYCFQNRPFLGICLGMQMMMDSSDEFGFHEGLGIIPGTVQKIPEKGMDGKVHRIPYIGWNEIKSSGETWQGSLLEGVEPETAVYFVHSYSAVPALAENKLAEAEYDGCIISAVIRKGNAYGCQFHPEKSGAVGLRIIKNFVEL